MSCNPPPAVSVEPVEFQVVPPEPPPKKSPVELNRVYKIRPSRAHAGEAPLAEAVRSEHNETVPTFWLRAGAGGAPLASVQLIAQDAPGDVFDVHTPEGTPLARIIYRKGEVLPASRRRRWTIHVVATGEVFVGKVGTWYAWTLSLLLAPIWFALLAVVVVAMILGDGSGDLPDAGWPKRIRWYDSGSGRALATKVTNGTKFRLDPRRLDYRIAYAQAIVDFWHRRHVG